MKIIVNIMFCTGIAAFSTQALAEPFDYHADAMSEVKWQLDGSDMCSSGDDCEDFFASSSYTTTIDDYLYTETANQHLWFHTDGSQDASWRSELRWLDEDGSSSGTGFAKSATKTMTVRFGQFNWGTSTTSDGFTVSQLHNSNDLTEGPVARLEYIDSSDSDGGYMMVTFRDDYDCISSDSTCTFTKRYWWNESASGWKTATITLDNYYVTVTVDGDSRTYKVSSAWEPQTEYYWKAGVYLQDAGTAKVAFDYIIW